MPLSTEEFESQTRERTKSKAASNIEELLKENAPQALFAKEIADGLGIRRQQVHQILRRFEQDGKVDVRTFVKDKKSCTAARWIINDKTH